MRAQFNELSDMQVFSDRNISIKGRDSSFYTKRKMFESLNWRAAWNNRVIDALGMFSKRSRGQSRTRFSPRATLTTYTFLSCLATSRMHP